MVKSRQVARHREILGEHAPRAATGAALQASEASSDDESAPLDAEDGDAAAPEHLRPYLAPAYRLSDTSYADWLKRLKSEDPSE